MHNIFKAMVPDQCFKKFDDIPFEELYKQGKTCLFLDYDNTIGPDRTWEPNDYSIEIIKKLKAIGFTLCLVSNAKSARSANIAKILDIPCVTSAHKPRTIGIERALKLVNADRTKTVMIGDQVFTDVMAGNFADMTTFFIERYQNKEVWYVKIKRPFEKIVRLFARF
ncbi:MAG: HAD-IIIA family hydrolase [Clostridia bacterium]|nr:HAD-IIIA family hydrolase [Clostridia bacterium]